MLAIRFSRKGKKKQPTYRLIVNEKTKDTQGDYLENLGIYNPRTKVAELKADRIKYWLGMGAQPSATVWNLLVSKGIIEGKKRKVSKISKKRAAKQATEAPKAEEAPKVAPQTIIIEKTPKENEALKIEEILPAKETPKEKEAVKPEIEPQAEQEPKIETKPKTEVKVEEAPKTEVKPEIEKKKEEIVAKIE